MSKDYLYEDNIHPEDQKYVCLSFLTDPKKNKQLTGVKIRGVFSTYELACEHAKKLQTVDPAFNVFVGDVGKWLPFDPNPDSIKDSEYANTELNNMMKAYLENQEKAKLFHEQRKNEMMKQNIIDNMTASKDNIKKINDQIINTYISEERTKLEEAAKASEDQISSMDKKIKELDKQLELLEDKIKSFA